MVTCIPFIQFYFFILKMTFLILPLTPIHHLLWRGHISLIIEGGGAEPTAVCSTERTHAAMHYLAASNFPRLWTIWKERYKSLDQRDRLLTWQWRIVINKIGSSKIWSVLTARVVERNTDVLLRLSVSRVREKSIVVASSHLRVNPVSIPRRKRIANMQNKRENIMN